MMVTNLYWTPATAVTLKNSYNELTGCGLTAGVSHYLSLWADCSGGIAELSIGDKKVLVETSQQIVANYWPSGTHLWINVSVKSGDPVIKVANIVCCEDFNATKQVLDQLGLAFFNGDTMPQA